MNSNRKAAVGALGKKQTWKRARRLVAFPATARRRTRSRLSLRCTHMSIGSVPFLAAQACPSFHATTHHPRVRSCTQVQAAKPPRTAWASFLARPPAPSPPFVLSPIIMPSFGSISRSYGTFPCLLSSSWDEELNASSSPSTEPVRTPGGSPAFPVLYR